MKLAELLLGANVVFVSTGRSDQKARLNCTDISFVILYMYIYVYPFPAINYYFTVPESTDTEIEKTNNFEFLNWDNDEFNYPVMSLNFPWKLRKNENTWPRLIAYDSSANQINCSTCISILVEIYLSNLCQNGNFYCVECLGKTFE